MRQPPAAIIFDERDTVMHASRMGRGAWLPALIVAGVLVATVGLAFAGTKTGGSHSAASPKAAAAAPSSSATGRPGVAWNFPWTGQQPGAASSATATSAPTLPPTPVPTATPQPGIALDPTKTRSAELPNDAIVLASAGSAVYYTTMTGDLWRLDVASLNSAELLVPTDSPCATNVEASASGPWLIYVSASPMPPFDPANGCATPSQATRWTVRLVDVRSITIRDVATLDDPAGYGSLAQPRVTVSADAGAFAMTSQAGPDSIRVSVKALDDLSTRWAASVDGNVFGIQLSPAGVLVTTPPPADQLATANGDRVLFVPGTTHSAVLLGHGYGARTGGSGRSVAWFTSGATVCDGISVLDVSNPDKPVTSAAVPVPMGDAAAVSCQLGLDDTTAYPFLAWQQTSPTPHIAIFGTVGATTGSIYGDVAPTWLSVDGGVLLWIGTDPTGRTIATAVAVASLGPTGRG